MSLAPGARLGAYEIVALIGAGGMGEVYSARDARLERDVAIKVLPSEFSADPERLQRFEQEARAAAALNHPNILGVFDVGTHGGAPYVVSELLEGETLRERLNAGPLPVRKAIECAIQIAHGLTAAHDKGIVHRDLKPENIFVTSDGRAKILDFGLAKLTHPDATGLGSSNLPTTPLKTQAGVLLGTIGYMSPEQARGLASDHRSDIFAFGVVVYEMLSGRRPFHRETTFETLTAIVKEDPPDMPVTERQIPPALARIINRCLEKNPASRFQSTRDLSFALDGITSATEGGSGAALTASGRRRVPYAQIAAAIAIFAVAFSAGRFGSPSRDESTAVSAGTHRSLNIKLPETSPLLPVGVAPLAVARPALAISRDGRRLVYVAEHNRGTQLILRNLSGFEVSPLPGTDGAYGPFFSPDGQWIGFFVGNQLKKMAITGGHPVPLCEATNTYGATWADDGFIYFSPHEASALWRVPAAGGRCEVALVPDTSKGVGAGWPHALPDGDVLLVTSLRGLAAVWPKTGQQKFLVNGAGAAIYAAASGHLIFMRPGGLMAARFDPVAAEIVGTTVPVLDGVRTEMIVAQFAVADDGTLVYVPGQSAALGRFVWVDRAGRAQPLMSPADMYGSFDLSPDEKQLVVSVRDPRGTEQVWIHDLVQGSRRRLTSTEERGSFPLWTPDGNYVTFSGIEPPALFLKAAAGNRTEVLIKSERLLLGDSWSHDGRLLALHDRSANADVVVLDRRDGQLRPFANTKFEEWGATFSPDGRWIAYTSDEPGDYQVFVQPYPSTGEKRQVSSTEGGNEEPVWSADGRDLFYRNGRRWIAVSIATEPKLAVGPPRVMVEGDYINVPGLSYNVSRDGRILLLEPIDPPRHFDLNIVENWFEELKRKVP